MMSSSGVKLRILVLHIRKFYNIAAEFTCEDECTEPVFLISGIILRLIMYCRNKSLNISLINIFVVTIPVMLCRIVTSLAMILVLPRLLA